MSIIAFRPRYPTFAKVAVKFVSVITSLFENSPFMFGFLWSFINNFGVGIDFVLSYLLMCPILLFTNWNPTSCTKSLTFSRISLTLSLSIYFDEYLKCPFTMVIFFVSMLLKLLVLSVGAMYWSISSKLLSISPISQFLLHLLGKCIILPHW